MHMLVFKYSVHSLFSERYGYSVAESNGDDSISAGDNDSTTRAHKGSARSESSSVCAF